MKKSLKYVALGFISLSSFLFQNCSKNDNLEGSGGDTYFNITVGFSHRPSDLFGGPTAYGANLYYGATDQITTGALIDLTDVYIQFPINYGETYDTSWNLVWGYSFYNGGMALSNWHDMEDNSYLNQLSVYNVSSPSGGNFVVSNGAAKGAPANPMEAKYSDYDGCGHIYVTDYKGYGVSSNVPGERVSGEAKSTFFRSVWINNTTYGFLTMKNGDAYASALNEENEGWFKVQFIAFSSDDVNGSPIGYTEAYLANFKKGQADDYMGIIDEWIKVDLSMLPETSILVINFVGSDTGEYGLNTPAYCALDNFEFSIPAPKC